ncbi:hypothetical protein NE237_001523 [Protea cynaroides]|uniref:Uncharacterized protein n=1 Tax=Protea cynaroides TaxID=273540 RepID=A0A9Q0KT91_9MAGN|nr:hypothetical protein NE237_001523 [Protea cynaroides]
MNVKWNPLQYRTYPQHLLNRGVELPPVDLFVTTADPVLEPPIITVNTVLSLLALDYPAHKLACYVSDDAASPLTFYSLMEASEFAKLWVPFCKKHDIQVRAPFMYFFGGDGEPNADTHDISMGFPQEWENIKNEYEQLCNRIEEAVQKGVPCDLTGEFADFSGINRRNHPSIVKTRVSGVMTNSPFILNVDCDMFANNPQVVLHAMCLLLGFEKETESGFVQFPQVFYGGLKDDPFGNQFTVSNEVGLIYGSNTEDVLTGISIHARGWRSVYPDLDSPAFLGCASTGGPIIMTQIMRWITGFQEILFSTRSPILAIVTAKLQFRQSLGYLYLLLWGHCSLPEFCYALLPAYSIFTNTHFLPMVSEPAIFILVALFIIHNVYTLLEYIKCGLSIRAWWNNMRMSRITNSTACLFGFLSFFPKFLGFSENVFEVTPKDQVTSIQGASVEELDNGRGQFTFNESPIFVPPTTLLFVNLTALAMAFLDGYSWLGLGEIFCSVWIVLTFLPFLKGLFQKGKYGVPWSTIWKSASLAFLFLYFSRQWASKGGFQLNEVILGCFKVIPSNILHRLNMKPRTNEIPRGQRSKNLQGGGPNWVLLVGGALLSTLSIRLGYKLRQGSDTKRLDDACNGLKGNVKSTDKRRSRACKIHSNVYSFTEDDDGCYNCISGSSDGTVKVKNSATCPILKEGDLSLPLVTITAPESNRENGVIWARSPDRLEPPPKPFHHSNCSDSPCGSESGSDIFGKREAIHKLWQQLKRRDEMILEMQDQITGLQNSLNVQLTHSANLQTQLDAANQDLFDSEREVQRLRKVIADYCVGEVGPPKKPTVNGDWLVEGRNGHSNGFPDVERDLDLVGKARDGERIEMLKREVGELKEVIEGKEYLLQNYKEQKTELSVKVKELQERLTSQVPSIL